MIYLFKLLLSFSIEALTFNLDSYHLPLSKIVIIHLYLFDVDNKYQ